MMDDAVWSHSYSGCVVSNRVAPLLAALLTTFCPHTSGTVLSTFWGARVHIKHITRCSQWDENLSSFMLQGNSELFSRVSSFLSLIFSTSSPPLPLSSSFPFNIFLCLSFSIASYSSSLLSLPLSYCSLLICFFYAFLFPLLKLCVLRHRSSSFPRHITIVLFSSYHRFFFPWYFSSWASGEPHLSGFKSQLVALSLWCVMFLVRLFSVDILLNAVLVFFPDSFLNFYLQFP